MTFFTSLLNHRSCCEKHLLCVESCVCEAGKFYPTQRSEHYSLHRTTDNIRLILGLGVVFLGWVSLCEGPLGFKGFWRRSFWAFQILQQHMGWWGFYICSSPSSVLQCVFFNFFVDLTKSSFCCIYFFFQHFLISYIFLNFTNITTPSYNNHLSHKKKQLSETWKKKVILG